MALLLYMMKAGRKNMAWMTMEWAGPRCSNPGIIMSMSGRRERSRTKGIFMFTFKGFEENLPAKYPKARCPTANSLFFPC